MRKDLLDQVVFPDQTFGHPNYDGSFRFKFYHFGEWHEIIIDDHLPCKIRYYIILLKYQIDCCTPYNT